MIVLSVSPGCPSERWSTFSSMTNTFDRPKLLVAGSSAVQEDGCLSHVLDSTADGPFAPCNDKSVDSRQRLECGFTFPICSFCSPSSLFSHFPPPGQLCWGWKLSRAGQPIELSTDVAGAERSDWSEAVNLTQGETISWDAASAMEDDK